MSIRFASLPCSALLLALAPLLGCPDDVVGGEDDAGTAAGRSDAGADELVEELGDCESRLRLDDGEDCRPVRVLLLNDGDSEGVNSGSLLVPLLQTPLVGGGGGSSFQVTDVEYIADWDGLVPAGTDVIFVAEGVDYTAGLTAEREAALTTFWSEGGGLVRSEWGTAFNENAPTLSPVFSDTVDYNEGEQLWSVPAAPPARFAPLVKGLPATFLLRHGATELRTKVAAETGDGDVHTLATLRLFEATADAAEVHVPALSVWPSTAEHGTIVHVNHDLLYSSSSLDEPELVLLLQNAVYGAASGL